jgi:cobalt-zinc-cadmium efflux system outer membrane protein
MTRLIRSASLAWLVLTACAGPALAQGPQEIVPLPAVDRIFTLDSCVRLALDNSPVLREARSAIEQAEGQRIQAGLYPNPRVDDGNPQFILGGQNSVYNAGLTQEVIRGGKRQLNMAAAQEAVRQAQLEFVRRRYDLLTDVRQQFFLLLATQQRAATTADLLNLTQHTEKTSQELLNAGRVSETDLLLARVERRKAEASLRNLQTMLTGGRQQLAAMLGLPQVAIDQVIGDLNAKLPDYEDIAVRQQLLTSNSEVQSARVDINRTRLLLDRARAEPIPNLALQGGYQHTQNLPNSQGVLGMYINVPIWDRNQGNIRSAGANVQQSMARLNTVQNGLLREIADAIARYRAGSQLVTSFERGILPDARRSMELVQQGYAAGQFDILRLLQTQRSLIEVTLDYIEAQQERLDAAAEIAGLLQIEQFP